MEPELSRLSSISRLTRGIAFLGTPHDGALDWADSLSRSTEKYIRRTHHEIQSVFRSNSLVVARIQKTFSTAVSTRIQEGLQPIQIACFYEELPTSDGQVGAKAWLQRVWATDECP